MKNNGKFWISVTMAAVSLVSALVGFSTSWALVRDRAMRVDELQKEVQQLREDIQIMKVKMDYTNWRLEKLEGLLSQLIDKKSTVYNSSTYSDGEGRFIIEKTTGRQ